MHRQQLCRSGLFIGFLVVTSELAAAVLPGFRVEKIAPSAGFVTSVAFDSQNRLYYSVRTGGIFRLDGTESVQVAAVETASVGNEALLGIAFRGPREIVAHYVAPDHTADVISAIDLETGTVTEIHRFVCADGQVCSSEHHGGNLIVTPDGSIFFGIGDLGNGPVAQDLRSPGGKIWRIGRNGETSMFALGFRNPFDMLFDSTIDRLILADNGPTAEDEVNHVVEGGNYGWPSTMGNQPGAAGLTGPSYVFTGVVAPTGMTQLREVGMLRARSVLVSTFVTGALYYFPTVSVDSIARPEIVIKGEVGPIIDVAQNETGEIYFSSSKNIYRLHPPRPGDANGDGQVDAADFEALSSEILDEDDGATLRAQDGAFRGSWGADVNRDGTIDAGDLVALAKLQHQRGRAARRK